MPDDDLLKPTIVDTPASVDRPWRVDSLVYPAFFGGPIAAAVLGAINARRLGVSGRTISLIAAAGATALAAQLLVAAFFLQETSGSVQRFSYSLAGVAVWGVVQVAQRRPFRVFLLRGGEPASLWGPGVGMVIVSALTQFLLLLLVNSAVK